MLGGSGKDSITTLGGSDVVMGDDGNLTFTAAGILTFATTSDPTYGDDDIINAGDGNNVVLGGSGKDSITTLGGSDVVMGDDGNLTFTAAGILTLAATSDPTYGGDDIINAGDGNNYAAVGGAGAGQDRDRRGQRHHSGRFRQILLHRGGPHHRGGDRRPDPWR